ncbi:MAG: hypothetical protein LBT01_08440 [Spirochaetaceae bacterium]|jgi:hypothetical protein|nr:hypothetical protein [Spirochaetaceae bacterium]
MKKNFGKAIALSALALMMCWTSCNTNAALDGYATVHDTMWISLTGPSPDDSGTAELILDFSESIVRLNDISDLSGIFTFAYYNEKNIKSIQNIIAESITRVEVGAGNIYKLKVKNVPKDGGRVEVTFEKSDVKPTMRMWYLDGSHDSAPPAILNFSLLSGTSTTGYYGSIQQGNITVIIPHSQYGIGKKWKPIIKINPGNTIYPANEVEKDFTNPITYEVTSASGAKKTYIVTTSATK